MEMVFSGQAAPHRTPHEISGGQQQRVTLARCAHCGNSLMLLDEPFSALECRPARRDASGNGRICFRPSGRGLGLLVTRIRTEALSLATQAAVMRSGRSRRSVRP